MYHPPRASAKAVPPSHRESWDEIRGGKAFSLNPSFIPAGAHAPVRCICRNNITKRVGGGLSWRDYALNARHKRR